MIKNKALSFTASIILPSLQTYFHYLIPLLFIKKKSQLLRIYSRDLVYIFKVVESAEYPTRVKECV